MAWALFRQSGSTLIWHQGACNPLDKELALCAKERNSPCLEGMIVLSIPHSKKVNPCTWQHPAMSIVVKSWEQPKCPRNGWTFYPHWIEKCETIYGCRNDVSACKTVSRLYEKIRIETKHFSGVSSAKSRSREACGPGSECQSSQQSGKQGQEAHRLEVSLRNTMSSSRA